MWFRLVLIQGGLVGCSATSFYEAIITQLNLRSTPTLRALEWVKFASPWVTFPAPMNKVTSLFSLARRLQSISACRCPQDGDSGSGTLGDPRAELTSNAVLSARESDQEPGALRTHRAILCAIRFEQCCGHDWESDQRLSILVDQSALRHIPFVSCVDDLR